MHTYVHVHMFIYVHGKIIIMLEMVAWEQIVIAMFFSPGVLQGWPHLPRPSLDPSTLQCHLDNGYMCVH